MRRLSRRQALARAKLLRSDRRGAPDLVELGSRFDPEVVHARTVNPHHLLLIGAGPGSVPASFGASAGRASAVRSSLAAEQLTNSPPELRSGGLEKLAVGADIEDMDGYRRRWNGSSARRGARYGRLQRCDARSGRDPRHDHRAAPNSPRRRRPRRDRRGTGSRARAAGSRGRHAAGHQRQVRRQPGVRTREPLDGEGRPALGSDADHRRRGGRRHSRRDHHDRRSRQTGDGLRSGRHRGVFWTAHTDSKDAWQTEYRFTGA